MNWDEKLGRFGKNFNFLLLAIFALLMVGLGLMGIWSICLGIWSMIFGGPVSCPVLGSTDEARTAATAISSAARGISYVLEGLEFLLIAPIPLIVSMSLWKEVVYGLFLKQPVPRPQQGAMIPGDGSQNIADRFDQVQGFDKAKELVFGLMLSVVATELVKRFLNRHTVCYGGHIDELIFGAFLFVALSSYLIIYRWQK